MLTNIRRRYDDFGLADIVIWNEDNFHQITNITIVVDNISNLVDKMNHSLGHPISRSSLTTKNGNSWNSRLLLLWSHLLDLEITMNTPKNVHLLPFILMYTFDLNIKKSSRVNCNAGCLMNMLCQSSFVESLDL